MNGSGVAVMERPIIPAANRRPDGKFGAGNVANPFGRPPVENSLADILRQAGEQHLADGRTYNQALADRLWNIALNEPSAEHATTAIRYLLNRLLGTPTETVQQTTVHMTIEQVVMLLQSAQPMLAIGEPKGESDSDDDAHEHEE